MARPPSRRPEPLRPARGEPEGGVGGGPEGRGPGGGATRADGPVPHTPPNGTATVPQSASGGGDSKKKKKKKGRRKLPLLGGLVVLVPYVRKMKSPGVSAGLAAGVMMAAWLSSTLSAVPGHLIAYGRRMAVNAGHSEVLYTIEGRNSSVAITRWNDGAIEIDVNGHVEATSEPYDMKLQRMVGHLPGVLHPNAKSVLGIGFGAGVSAGTFTRYPNIEHITVCEIEPVIPPTSTKYFGKYN